ncbi:MAG: hypothetical protein WDN47_03255 [Candidatus Doudnabacteria bacterium]
MSEQEPNFEQQLEALKFSVQTLGQESDPVKILDMARDLISSVPERSNNLMPDFMSDRQKFITMWEQAKTEESKTKIKLQLKQGLERIIDRMQQRPKAA